MRDNWLSNRIFTSYDNLLDHCCYAWNKLINQPWTIMSIGLRDLWPTFSRVVTRQRMRGEPSDSA